MGFDLGGVFGNLSSFKMGISDFDFSSPVKKTTKTKERLGDFELHSSPRKKANETTMTKSIDSKLQRVHCYKKN